MFQVYTSYRFFLAGKHTSFILGYIFNGDFMFRTGKVRKSIIKIALAATASDGAILEKTDTAALSSALPYFDLFKDLSPEKVKSLVKECFDEIRKTASQGRIVDETAKSCQILKKNSIESETALNAALFVCLYDGELCGHEVGYIETLNVNLHISRNEYNAASQKMSLFIENNKDSFKRS